ncbi:MAG: hypothetical protein ABSG32_05310 [Terriglobia bacterium]
MTAQARGDKQPTLVPLSAAPVLTILVPAHNEEDIIAAAVSQWHAEVITNVPGSHLLVMGDASTNGTPEVLGQLTRALPGFCSGRRRHARRGFLFAIDRPTHTGRRL